MTSLVDRGRKRNAVDIMYLDFSKALEMVSNDNLVDKLVGCGGRSVAG